MVITSWPNPVTSSPPHPLGYGGLSFAHLPAFRGGVQAGWQGGRYPSGGLGLGGLYAP